MYVLRSIGFKIVLVSETFLFLFHLSLFLYGNLFYFHQNFNSYLYLFNKARGLWQRKSMVMLLYTNHKMLSCLNNIIVLTCIIIGLNFKNSKKKVTQLILFFPVHYFVFLIYIISSSDKKAGKEMQFTCSIKS